METDIVVFGPYSRHFLDSNGHMGRTNDTLRPGCSKQCLKENTSLRGGVLSIRYPVDKGCQHKLLSAG